MSKNAFFFFMLDWKAKQEKSGKVFPNGLKDVQTDPQLTEDWRNISHEDKAYYQSKAKDNKIQSKGSAKKKTSCGESITDVEEQAKKDAEFMQKMQQYIDSVTSVGIHHNSLEKIKFLLIHVNWFFKREIGINHYDFCPAEFAVAEFSLGEGIQNIYHEIVSTKIPLGWKRDALEMSFETHKIPVEHPDGQSDFAHMYNEFMKIIEANKTGTTYPPLFTITDLIPAVKSLLQRMCEATNNNPSEFVVYTVEALFAGLRNAAAQSADDCSIPFVVASNEFAKDVFASTSGLECEFHKILDSPTHCSMSIIKRWGFTICDYCCEYLDIDMIEGVHYPSSKSDSSTADSINVRFKALNINNPIKLISETGVGADYREKVSARNHIEDERREREGASVQIIDHSKDTGNDNFDLPARPLRLPNTVPKVLCETDNTFNVNDSNFPPIGGRGTTIKTKTKDMSFPALGGKGRGKYL